LTGKNSTALTELDPQRQLLALFHWSSNS